MSFINGVLSNKILIAASCGWLVAQVLKTIIYVAVNKNFNLKGFWETEECQVHIQPL